MDDQLDGFVKAVEGRLVIGNQDTLNAFGNEPQSQLRYVSKAMSEIALRSTSDLELLIHNVLAEIDGTGISTEKNHFISGPFRSIGQKRLIKQYKALIQKINEMARALQMQQVVLLKEISRLKRLEALLKECSEKLEKDANEAAYISNALKEEGLEQGIYRAENIPPNELKEWQSRLDRRVEDLRISHTVSLQNMAQIKILKENDRQIVDRITSVVSNTIPIWRNQVVLLLHLEQYKDEIEVHNKLGNVINNSIQFGSQQIEKSSKKMKRKGIDTENLEVVNDQLSEVLRELVKAEQQMAQHKSATGAGTIM